jgi:hypothetical protein
MLPEISKLQTDRDFFFFFHPKLPSSMLPEISKLQTDRVFFFFFSPSTAVINAAGNLQATDGQGFFFFFFFFSP